MKIFFLIHDDYAAGGLQRSTMAARGCFAAEGHDVQIQCVRLEHAGLATRFDFVRGVTAPRSSKLLFWPAFLRDLRRLIRTEQPDLCIGMGLSTSIFLALATIGLPGPRLFGSERAYPPATPTSFIWRLLRRLTFTRLDGLVCQTRQTAAHYAGEMGIGADKLFVIPNVIDPPLAELPPVSQKLASLDGHPLVACIGRLEPQKGFDMALPIFAGILEHRPDARFVIIGEGPLEAQYHALAHDLGIANEVLFLPRFAHLAEIWAQVDIFLLTSRFEGIPNVLGEAMANGIACVSFDCPTGPSELLTDGKDGYLVDLGDQAAAIQRCVELIENPALRAMLGSQARSVSARYSAGAISRLWNGLTGTA